MMEDKLKDQDTVEDLIEQFKHLDRDNDGLIPVPEFKQYMAMMRTRLGVRQKQKLVVYKRVVTRCKHL